MSIKRIFLILVLLFSYELSFAQVKTTLFMEGENKAYPISSFESNNMLFCSAKNIALAFNANHFYNKEASKIEIKFTNYNIKFTANNHYVVITDRRDDSKKIYQLPQSVKKVNEDIFIPIQLMVEYLEYASGRNITFESETGIISVLKPGSQKQNVVINKTEEKEEKTEVKPLGYNITEIKIDEKSNGTLVRMVNDKKNAKFSVRYDNNVLTVVLIGVEVDPIVIDKFAPVGIINSMDVKKKAEHTEIKFKVADGYTAHDSFQDSGSGDLIIAIHNKKLKGEKKNDSPIKNKWNFDVIVLDAGHGGKDAGAIGVTKVKEKTINLALALKVGKLIEQNLPDVKVVYTRKGDNFVELYKRGKIANENNGKLFISIHCNSTPNKSESARGFEVYLLRPGRTQEAISIAEFENSVIQYEEDPNRYQKLTDENFILVSMAQSSYMRYSEKFSDILNSTWKANLNIPSRGVKQAGFYVLVGASMPNVLVEAGFLSNKKDEAFLKSESGQNDIAETIYKAIEEYKKYYEQAMSEELH